MLTNISRRHLTCVCSRKVVRSTPSLGFQPDRTLDMCEDGDGREDSPDGESAEVGCSALLDGSKEST